MTLHAMVDTDFTDLSAASSVGSYLDAPKREPLAPLDNLPHNASCKLGASSASKHAVKSSLLTARNCAACRVLAGQVERVSAEIADLERQTGAARLDAADADAALQAEDCLIAQLGEENATMEKQCRAAQAAVDDQEAANENAWARWRDEVAAWRTLHNDAQHVVDTSVAKIDDLEQKRVVFEEALEKLPECIEATCAEVERLHSVQSNIEAQSLQDEDWAREEVKRLDDAAARASVEAAAAREKRGTAERQLDEQTDEAARQLSRLQEYQTYCADSVKEISVARQVITEVRQECIEERRCCSNAVDLLHEAEQRCILRCSRGTSPIPNSTLVDLTSQLELCMQRARTLEADNEAIRSQRRREAEHCRDAVKHLRARVHRYRARCDELRNLSQEESFPDLFPLR